MSCYTGWRGWQSLNTGPRFYLRLIRRTGWLWIYTSHTTDGCPFKQKSLSVPFLYPGVPAGLTPFRGLVRRNLVPILPPALPLGVGDFVRTVPKSNRKNVETETKMDTPNTYTVMLSWLVRMDTPNTYIVMLSWLVRMATPNTYTVMLSWLVRMDTPNTCSHVIMVGENGYA